MFSFALNFHLLTNRNSTKTNIPAFWPGCRINGYTLYLVFQSKHGWGLTATALVSAVKAFVTGSAAHHDMAAYVTGWCITLHTLGSSI